MSPFLEIADLVDGTFAVIAIDPTRRVAGGCTAIVQSLHKTRVEAASAIEARRAETAKTGSVHESAIPQGDAHLGTAGKGEAEG